MKVYDLSPYGINKVSFYLAIEEYLLNKKEEAFFIWRIPKSIVIGKNQILELEVNIPYAKEVGIEFNRRPSGGGCVYADEGCFMFTFITKEMIIDKIYSKYLGLISGILNKYNLEVVFSKRNDLLLNGKKFSGNSIYRTSDTSVLHGTILYNTDLDVLENVLTPEETKLRTKGIRSVRERVINLKNFTNLSQNELISALEEGISPQKTVIGEDEIKKVRLLQDKILLKMDCFKRKVAYSYQNAIRFPCGLIDININIGYHNQIEIVDKIEIYGDFFVLKPLENFIKLFLKIPFSKSTFLSILSNNHIDNYIDNCTDNDFIRLIFGG